MREGKDAVACERPAGALALSSISMALIATSEVRAARKQRRPTISTYDGRNSGHGQHRTGQRSVNGGTGGGPVVSTGVDGAASMAVAAAGNDRWRVAAGAHPRRKKQGEAGRCWEIQGVQGDTRRLRAPILISLHTRR